MFGLWGVGGRESEPIGLPVILVILVILVIHRCNVTFESHNSANQSVENTTLNISRSGHSIYLLSALNFSSLHCSFCFPLACSVFKNSTVQEGIERISTIISKMRFSLPIILFFYFHATCAISSITSRETPVLPQGRDHSLRDRDLNKRHGDRNCTPESIRTRKEW